MEKEAKEYEGKSLDVTIWNASQELKISIEKMHYEILDEGKRGSGPARIRVFPGGRPTAAAKPARPDRSERPERARPEPAERAERAERVGGAEGPGDPEPVEGPPRAPKESRPERVERPNVLALSLPNGPALSLPNGPAPSGRNELALRVPNGSIRPRNPERSRSPMKISPTPMRIWPPKTKI